jgi:hypothetical protein
MLNLNTTELRIGDVVHLYGMRIRLDNPPHIEQRERTVYAWVGDVLNPDEVIAAGVVPRSFLGDNYWIEGQGWMWFQTNKWTVQGNDLARWAVERAAAEVTA